MLAIHKKMLCTYYFLLIHDVNKRPILAKFLLGDFSSLIQALFFSFYIQNLKTNSNIYQIPA